MNPISSFQLFLTLKQYNFARRADDAKPNRPQTKPGWCFLWNSRPYTGEACCLMISGRMEYSTQKACDFRP